MPDEDKKPVVKVDTTKATKVGVSLLPEIRKQFEFIRDYTNSDKYKERLGRMVNTERMLQNTTNPGRFNNEVMAQSQTTDPTNQVVDKVLAANNESLGRIAGKTSVGDVDLGRSVAGAYDSSIGDIRLREDLVANQAPTTMAHETSHGLNDSRQPYSPAFDERYLRKIFIPPTNSRFEGEIQKPTEVKARLDAVRYLGNKYGIFDAGKTNFTGKDYDNLLKNKEVREDINFKQIISQFPQDRKKANYIWLMNNIAKTGDDFPNENVV